MSAQVVLFWKLTGFSMLFLRPDFIPDTIWSAHLSALFSTHHHLVSCTKTTELPPEPLGHTGRPVFTCVARGFPSSPGIEVRSRPSAGGKRIGLSPGRFSSCLGGVYSHTFMHLLRAGGGKEAALPSREFTKLAKQIWGAQKIHKYCYLGDEKTLYERCRFNISCKMNLEVEHSDTGGAAAQPTMTEYSPLTCLEFLKAPARHLPPAHSKPYLIFVGKTAEWFT